MFVTQDQFDQLKQRYSEYQDDGFSGLDKGMENIIQELNKLNGVVTVWCCEGHYKPPRKQGSSAGARMHVVMAVTDQTALKNIYDICEAIGDKLEFPVHCRLELVRLIWPTGESTLKNNTYPTVCLNLYYRIPAPEQESKIKEERIKFFEEAIRYVSVKQRNVGGYVFRKPVFSTHGDFANNNQKAIIQSPNFNFDPELVEEWRRVTTELMEYVNENISVEKRSRLYELFAAQEKAKENLEL